MVQPGRDEWRGFAAALLIAASVLCLGFVLRSAGLGVAANVAQLVSLAPLFVGLAKWPRSVRSTTHSSENIVSHTTPEEHSSNFSANSSTEEQMRIARSLSAMKASEDFRNHRVYPLLAIGTFFAIAFGAMQEIGLSEPPPATPQIALREFGNDFGQFGFEIGLVVLMALAFLVLFIARLVQSWDEETLYRIFDPDIQAIALREVGLDGSFTRTEFRNSLLRTADNQIPPQWSFIHHWLDEGTRTRVRYSDSGFTQRGDAGTPDAQYGGAANPHVEESEIELPPIRGFLRIGRILTTVDIASALEEAAELAITRYAGLDLLDSAQELGTTTFRIR